MKTKRTLAALLAAVMLLSSLGALASASAPAAAPRDADDGEEATLDSVLNVENGAIHFISYGETPFVPAEGGGRTYAVSTVENIETGASVLYFSMFMELNSALFFEYNADVVSGCGVSLYVNGVRPDIDEEGLAGKAYNGWVSYAYIAPARGSYAFELRFDRYESQGQAFVKIDNFEYSADPGVYELAQAVNTGESSYAFVTAGSNGFITESAGGRTYARSVRGGAHSFSQLQSTYDYFEFGDVISFDYCVTAGNSDDLALIRIGRSILPIYSNQTDGQWHTYTETVFEDSELELAFCYFCGAGSGGSGCIKVDNVRVTRYEPVTMDEALNVPGGELTFTYGGEIPFEPVNLGGRAYAHMSDGNGYINTSLHMQANSALTFELCTGLSWQGSGVHFTVNGVEKRFFSVYDSCDGWIRYTYIVPEEGDYSFSWQARCEAGGMINVDNVEYLTEPCDAAVTEAVGAPGCGLEFFTYGSHAFVPETDGERTYVRSDNANRRYTTSVLETKYAQLEAGDVLSFDYLAFSDCEKDLFEFCVNGERIFYIPCIDTDELWHTYYYTVETSGLYCFTWKLFKGLNTSVPSKLLLDNAAVLHGETHEPVSIDDALNVPGGELHFGTQGRPFKTEEFFGRTYAVAGVQQQWGTYTLYTTVHLEKNQLVTFEYEHIGYQYNYGLKFTGGGESFNTTSGHPRYGWTTYAFVAPYTANFTLKWDCEIPVYDSDSLDHPMHIRVDNVNVHAPFDASLGAALNAEGGDIDFFTYGRVTFVAAEENGRTFAVSDTVLAGTLSPTLRTAYIDMEAGETLSFDYQIKSSEHAQFMFFANEQNDLYVSADSNTPAGWQHYVFTAPADGSYIFTWMFGKSGSEWQEQWVRIDNVRIGHEMPMGLGDVDSDGSVTAMDALYVIRYSLGLMELLDMELEHADVDGDGNITANDALLILRVALGLATL